jgi:hypothetical protein
MDPNDCKCSHHSCFFIRLPISYLPNMFPETVQSFHGKALPLLSRFHYSLLYCYQGITRASKGKAPNSSLKQFCSLFRYCRLQSHLSTHLHLATKRITRNLISPSLVVVLLSNQEELLLQLTGPELQDCSTNRLLNHVCMQ